MVLCLKVTQRAFSLQCSDCAKATTTRKRNVVKLIILLNSFFSDFSNNLCLYVLIGKTLISSNSTVLVGKDRGCVGSGSGRGVKTSD